MQNNPLVSVVMSTFNAEKYVAEAIESILSQTYSCFEFIIINDGSTDSSFSIIQEYANQDQRIKIINNDKNIGLAKSLNKGIDLSQGVFIARMDADDISTIDRFEKQVAYLTNHPEICLLGGQIKFIDSSNNGFQYAVEKELLRWHLLLNIPIIAHPTVMMNRQSIILVGKYPENYIHAEDRALWTKLYTHFEFPAANLPDILLYYRIHANNVSVKNKPIQQVANQELTLKFLSHEFNCIFDENIVNAMVNSNNLTYQQAKYICENTFFLFDRFLSNHNLKDNPIEIKLKQTTASFIFSRIYKFPIRGFLQITKSVIFYFPILKEYVKYYSSVPAKILFFVFRKIRIN